MNFDGFIYIVEPMLLEKTPRNFDGIISDNIWISGMRNYVKPVPPCPVSGAPRELPLEYAWTKGGIA